MSRLTSSPILALFFACCGALLLHPAASTPTGPAGLTRPASSAIASFDPSPYVEAATDLRRGAFDSARERVTAQLADGAIGVAESNLILGLFAHVAGRHEAAIGLLTTTAPPIVELEDWRLHALAESASQVGNATVSRAALQQLIDQHSSSPLRSRALVAAARHAWLAEDASSALELILRARAEEVPREESLELETIAWAIGSSLGDHSVQSAAARQLLARHPLAAAEMEVIEIFRAPGELDWNAILSPAQLLERARNLVAADILDGALDTIDSVPQAQRGFEWGLFKAEILTRSDRGDAALAALMTLHPEGATQQADYAWRRAMAAFDQAKVKRGRDNLPSAARTQMRQLAHDNLWRAIDLDLDPDRSIRALKLLYGDYVEAERFESAMDVLRRLRELDARDYTGVRHLWQRGWHEYEHGNFSSAIGYWRELQNLYPESRFARGAKYWSARSHERLGNRERATQDYRQIAAADTHDFYRRYALARVDDTAESPRDPVETLERWPRNAALERAEILTELGLDEFALIEIDAATPHDAARAVDALEAEVLSRLGRPRESIQAAWRAFPSLGRAHQATVPKRAKQLYYPLVYDQLIRQHAQDRRLQEHLVFAMIRQESGFDATAKSWAGARGLMQLMPATAREIAERLGLRYSTTRLNEPEFSVRLGTTYFKQVLDMFDGNVELALAGYNGGPYRIKRLWRGANQSEPDAFLEGLSLEETKLYVKRIVLFEDSYRQLYPAGTLR